jgi:hypothetical protein
MLTATKEINASGVRQCAERVNTALQDVLNRIPPPNRSPKDLARKLKVHRTLASRLLGALRMSDPLAVVANIPGKQGIAAILDAAESLVGADPVREARTALNEFESLVEHGLGGREVLDVALRAWLPETRDKHDLACRQQVFRGMCGLAGVTADVTIDAAIRYPSEDGEHANIAEIHGLVGLRRLSPGRDIPVGSLGMIPGVKTASGAYIQNLPGRGGPEDRPIIEEFSSARLPAVRELRMGNFRQYFLSGEEIGNRSKVDVFTALVTCHIGPLYREEGSPPRRTGGAHMVEVPTRTLLMDRFVLDDGSAPKDALVLMHRPGMRGAVDPNDPMRDIDRLDCNETIQFLGRGSERFGALEVARYPELIRHVCGQLGLDAGLLLGHRCRVQYPLPHVQYSMGYLMPSREEARLGRTADRRM